MMMKAMLVVIFVKNLFKGIAIYHTVVSVLISAYSNTGVRNIF